MFAEHPHPPLRRAPSPAIHVCRMVVCFGGRLHESTTGKFHILQLKCGRKSNWDEVICG